MRQSVAGKYLPVVNVVQVVVQAQLGKKYHLLMFYSAEYGKTLS